MIQVEDLTIGVTHGIFQLLAQDNYLPVRIELPHQPLCSTTVYENFFGTEVVFVTERNAVFVETSTMKISLANRSELLRQMATQFLDVQLPSPDGLWSTRVATAVRRTLSTDSCNRLSIARAMAITPRTLSRRLQQEGESFDGIRDRVRRERTEYYLCETNAPLAQVAALMGYGEQSTLTRSCQRWFGASPLKLRSKTVV